MYRNDAYTAAVTPLYRDLGRLDKRKVIFYDEYNSKNLTEEELLWLL